MNSAPLSAPLKNEQGFTLVEILIAGAMLTVITLGMTSMLEFTHRAVQTTTAISDFNTLVTTIQGVVNNASNCASAFGGKVVNTPYPASVVPLYSNGGSGVLIANSGNFGTTLKITKLHFPTAPTALAAANTYLANLYLEATRSVGGGAIGFSLSTHTFPMVLTLDPTTRAITGCSGLTDTLWQKVTTSSDIYYTNGKVGVGTNAPRAALDVSTLTDNLDGIVFDHRSDNVAYMQTYIDNQWSNRNSYAPWCGAGGCNHLLIQPDGGDTTIGGNTWIVANGSGGMAGAGNLTLSGAIYENNSDIYFSGTGHAHTGIGNSLGWAAIENGANYNTLMILGRSTGIPGTGRSVSVWDTLTINGTFINNSDIRLKEDLARVTDPIDKLLQLNGYSFTWKKTKRKDMGVIAQEVEKVFPDLVDESARDSDTGQRFKAVQYLGLFAPVIEGFKEFYGKWFSDSEAVHRELAELKRENGRLREQNAAFQLRLDKIENGLKSGR